MWCSAFCILTIIIASSHISEKAFPFAFYTLNWQADSHFSSFCYTEETTVEDDEPVKKKKKKKDKEKQAEEEEASPTVEVRQNCTATWSFMGMDSLENMWSEGENIFLSV